MASDSENILTELECMVCNEYMYPPIKQCTEGHSMCTLCFDNVSSCPTCRAELGTSRNFALENIAAKINVPCKYKSKGCHVIQTGGTIRLHEEFCEHGEVFCPLKDSTKCTWVGKPKDIVNHAKENHDQHPPVVNNTEVRIKNFVPQVEEGVQVHYRLVDAHDKIFKYCIKINYEEDYVEWNVQFVGPREAATDYSYIIECIDKNEGTKKLNITSTCSQLVKDEETFASASSCSIYFSKLQTFCSDDNCLYFNFQIVPTKDLENNVIL